MIAGWSALLLTLLGLALLVAFGRIARGPSLADRVVALDVVAVIGVAFASLYAISTDEPVFLDVAIVLTLVSFVGTAAFSRYLERRGSR